MLLNKVGMMTQYRALTDAQWQSIAYLLPVQRKRKLALRQVVDALLYLVRTGCQWRNLPTNFPHWQAVYYYFDRWKHNGVIDQLNQALNQVDRKSEGRAATPSLVCADSQSVKLAPMVFEDRGFDAHKKVNGRKRQVLVDSDGRIWCAYVHAANRSDSSGGCGLLLQLPGWDSRLKKVLADSAYRGRFSEFAQRCELVFEVASRRPLAAGFIPVKKRWVVERTFAWLNYYRRVTKDYEHTTESAEAWLLWANCAIILNRIPV